jgi:hypothetical protein
MTSDSFHVERLLVSGRRWRIAFPLLAILVPSLLYGLFQRQVLRLEALADHGQRVIATVNDIEQRDSGTFVTYQYRVGNEVFTWSVSQRDAPHTKGENLTVLYLPEDPSFTRPGTDTSKVLAEAKANRAFTTKLLLGVFFFFVINAVIHEVKMRRLRRLSPVGHVAGEPLISPVWVGRIIGVLLLGAVIATNFDEDVVSVHRRAFGDAPLGLPVQLVVSVAEIILFAPFILVFQHLVMFASRAFRDGESLSRSGLAMYVLQAPQTYPELRRSRTVCLAGLVYFGCLVGSWIAFASSRGV